MMMSREHNAERGMVLRPLRIAAALFIALALAAGLVACGPYDRHKSCSDYKPLDFCEFDLVYVCEESRAGCEQCSCVSPDDAKNIDGAR
jgi:hypothetical protein